MVIVVPLTTSERGIPAHIEICPPEGGLKYKNYAMCEMIRSISKERMSKRLGIVSDDTMIRIEKNLKRLLGFYS